MVSVYDMKIHPTDHFLVMGTHARSMYKLDLNFITNVNEENEPLIVKNYELKQNYPNPFNPNTNIQFTIPTSDQVKIRIYNSAGQLIDEIINQAFTAGTHSVSWDGRNLNGKKAASGIYIYALESGNQKITRKMILSK